MWSPVKASLAYRIASWDEPLWRENPIASSTTRAFVGHRRLAQRGLQAEMPEAHGLRHG
jgi:hypothetical protein